MPTPADLFLSPDLTEDQARAYLESLGFRDPAAADDHLQRMADDLVVREALGRLAPDLIASLLESPDPDAAVVGVSRYVAARTGRVMLLDYLREDPRALHVLTYVMGASPMLGEILVRTPEYFHWLVSQVERSAPDRQDHEEELVSALASVDDPIEALNFLRRWKRRETLRIGTRELLRRETIQTVSTQLSDVASVAIEFALAIVTRQLMEEHQLEQAPGAFAVIAMGHLGAGEMSYTSDIDLIYVYDMHTADDATRVFFVKAGDALTAALGDETHEGSLYRVSLPAWSHADGLLRAGSLEEFGLRFAGSRSVLERWVLTRARTVAGDPDLGRRFMAHSEAFVYGDALDGSSTMVLPRALSDQAGEEVERVTQVLQLRHGPAHPPLRRAGTLGALAAVCRAGLIDEGVERELNHAYMYLRSAEHRRQLGLKEDVDKSLAASRERVREICRKLMNV